MKCLNCRDNVRKSASWCSKKECNRARCRNYYRKNVDIQKARTLKGYYKYISTEDGHRRIRKINMAAKARARFGISDREEIMKKFNSLCVFCKCKAKIIHHLDNVGRGTKNPNNDVNNLVAVCASCHARIHLQGKKLEMNI